MHRVFQSFIDGLIASGDAGSLRAVLADAGAALDLSCFAYLSLPSRRGGTPELISIYRTNWTDRCLQQRYERVDPVIIKALATPEPFEWGQELSAKRLSKPQQGFFDEAAQFGIRCGFTVPVHDPRGPIAAVTFATDERRATFHPSSSNTGMSSSSWRCTFTPMRAGGLPPIVLSRCRAFSARTGMPRMGGARKVSAGDRTPFEHLAPYGGVLSRQSMTKFGVRTICQAVAKLAAAKSTSE